MNQPKQRYDWLLQYVSKKKLFLHCFAFLHNIGDKHGKEGQLDDFLSTLILDGFDKKLLLINILSE